MNTKPRNAISKKVWLEHMEQTTGLKVPTAVDLVAQGVWKAAHRQHLDSGCPVCKDRSDTRRWERDLKQPSLQTLERWSCDGVAKALDGCRVEPDGHCQHGFPSWILYLGYC